MVPAVATSKRPFFVATAPVKDPFTCPKSSDSRKLVREGSAVDGNELVSPGGG